MTPIQIGSARYNKADTWAEVAPIYIGRLLLLARFDQADRVRPIWEEIVRICLNMPVKNWEKLTLSIEQWKTLKAECAWVFTEPVSKTQPYKYFVHKKVVYYLPDSNHDTTTALEIAWANMYYLQFAHPANPDLSALDRLIATLCRPQRHDWNAFKKHPNFNGDRREPFNDFLTTQRALQLSDLPIETRVAILTFFQANNNDFMEEFEEMFGKPDGPPRYGNGEGWLTMIKNIAKTGTFGNFDAVCSQPARLVWLFALDDKLDLDAQAQAFDNANQNAD